MQHISHTGVYATRTHAGHRSSCGGPACSRCRCHCHRHCNFVSFTELFQTTRCWCLPALKTCIADITSHLYVARPACLLTPCTSSPIAVALLPSAALFALCQRTTSVGVGYCCFLHLGLCSAPSHAVFQVCLHSGLANMGLHLCCWWPHVATNDYITSCGLAISHSK